MAGSEDDEGPRPLPPGAYERMMMEFARHDAQEHQRRLVQGLGKPIISTEMEDGMRIVGVGRTLYWSKNWRTFPDFLGHYVKHVFGFEWGAAEQKKPLEERHPFMRWNARVGEYARSKFVGPEGTIQSTLMGGAVKAYLTLAYDLYLIEHNAEVPQQLMDSLRDPNQFEGAVHEAHVCGIFAKAGFKIDMEDQRDTTTSHHEFIATHIETGKKFAVEAKAFTTASARAGVTDRPPSVQTKLKKALHKKTEHERIVFIELARAPEELVDGEPAWLPGLDAEIEQTEKDLEVRGRPAPPAYLFVINRSCLAGADDEFNPTCIIAYGFKIPDFKSHKPIALADAVKARRKHAPLEALFSSLNQTLDGIPNTFDERLPEEVHGVGEVTRLRVGQVYSVPDADGVLKPGLLLQGVVHEATSKVLGFYRLEDGRTIQCITPLTEREMEIYRASPRTFFGVLDEPPRGIKTPLDAFDFCYRAYGKCDRAKLLQLMANWPEVAELTALSLPDLLDHYCVRMATQIWLSGNGQKRAAA